MCVGAQRLWGPFIVSLGIVEKLSPFVDLKITWLSASSCQPSCPGLCWTFPCMGRLHRPIGPGAPGEESPSLCWSGRRASGPFTPARGGGCCHSTARHGSQGPATWGKEGVGLCARLWVCVRMCVSSSSQWGDLYCVYNTPIHRHGKLRISLAQEIEPRSSPLPPTPSQ